MFPSRTLQRNVVVVGASAGGIEALSALLALLPADFPAALFVVIHVAADSPGVLPNILARAGELPVETAKDGNAIRPGHVYVAPPDRHLLLEQGNMRVTRGPKENRFRPAVDPLFRSAAQAYGRQVIGIVLSGSLDDGAAGLWAVKGRGGLAIVQEPGEAAYPSMPLSAMQYVAVDYRVTIAEMGKLLPQLVGAVVEEKEAVAVPDKIEIETRIASEDNPLAAGVMELGPLSPYTCPECSGVLVQVRDGELLRFRCHTGHAYSMESLMVGINESIDKTLWNTVRALEEHMLLLRHLGKHAHERQDDELARRLDAKALSAQDQVQIVRQLVIRHANGDQ
jgi:two-component system, chemotaxis family, protein-glutamate methylesterase/glutaminase